MVRFVMIGGFLGAGKTTTIARLAAHYQQQGLRVGIVTNDQAQDLVDTHRLRAAGYEVGEVAGACFCCHFDDLTDTVANLEAKQAPDVVLAEPVGSCTDLVATVIQPLRGLHKDRFEVSPYGVILKPSHGLRILRNQANGGFSPDAAYIFRKQLEEADFVIINRIDQLEASQIDELAGLLEAQFPGTPIVRMSAETGEGFASLVEQLDQKGAFGRRILDLDYDVYAAGEAELGWLNSRLHLSADEPFALQELVVELVDQLRLRLAEEEAETAHLKVIASWKADHAAANLVSRDAQAELSMRSECQTTQADVIVNARVAMDPERLQAVVEEEVERIAASRTARVEVGETRSFRPGRPVPTHRYNEPVS